MERKGGCLMRGLEFLERLRHSGGLIVVIVILITVKL
jgi:hypothetical protein